MNNNILRILLITDQFTETTASGTGVYAVELANTLSTLNCKLHVIAPGTYTHSEELTNHLVVHYKKTLFRHLFRMPIYAWQVCKSWKQIYEEENINCIISNNNAGVWVGRNKPLIAVIQHPAMSELKNLDIIQKILSSVDVLLEGIIVRHAKRIVVTSNMVHNEILKIYPFIKSKLSIIPIGVDFKKYSCENKISNDIYTILFPGGKRLKRKGAEYLFPALKKLVNEKPFKLIITGNCREIGWDELYEKAIMENNLKQHIEDKGEVNYSDMVSLYSGADLVVFPSIFEGYGIPILEALAMGKPVVTTNTGIAMEVIKPGENGILVDIKNPDQIYSSILELMNDKILTEKISNNARKSVINDYSWENVALRMIELCKTIANY